MKPTANDMLALLDQRFPVEKYLTVSECKIGSTWFKPVCSRFDFWAMARSWAHPRFIGCEIKVSRQDFMNDTKWPDYLPYCTEFYFVAPPGIIDPAEVPEQSGLMVATKNLKRLIVKKKAPVRDVEIPQSIFIYILMCRTRVVSDTGRPKADIWRDRLKELESNKRLGWQLSSLIGDRVDSRVKEIKAENRRLKDENGKLQVVKNLMDEIGISVEDLGRGGRMMIERKFKEAMTGIPYDLPGFLSEIQAKAGQALEVLKP